MALVIVSRKRERFLRNNTLREAGGFQPGPYRREAGVDFLRNPLRQ